MKKVVLKSLVLLMGGFVQAQDLEQVKKTIDAEKYSDARKSLKNMIKNDPGKGKNYFYLGQLYLTLEKQDSAKIYFEQGKAAKEAGHLNLIGLAHLDLINGNKSSASNGIATALQNAKKKDTEEQIFIAKAYMNNENPDFPKAVEAAKKAVASDAKSALAYLVLGDAQLGNKNSNDAYAAYRNAFDIDNTLLRAKLQLAAITRNAQAYPEATKAIREVIAMNANYGPAYRELAETNLAWAFSKNGNFQEKVKEALTDYKKYMSLTDSSVDSRVRYADFLILTKNWKELETEALAIQKMDKFNPKVLRYLGYAYYENGNAEGAVKTLTEYITKVDPRKVKGRDYYFIGKSKLTGALDANGMLVNEDKFNTALVDLTKAAEMDNKLGDEFSEIGVKFYKNKSYAAAYKVLELAIKNKTSKTYVTDSYYYGNSILYAFADKTADVKAKNQAEFTKADAAFAEVIKVSPTTQDAYLSKAKLNRVAETDSSKLQAIQDYEGYLTAVNAKGTVETSKDNVKKNMFDAYSFIAASNAATNKAKAIEYFEKALALNPTDKYVKESLSVLKK